MRAAPALLLLCALVDCGSATTEPGPTCPTTIYTDRGCTQKDYTEVKAVASADACCALCFSQLNATAKPCKAWTYHAKEQKCELAPYPTIIFGPDKISGSFVPTPAPPPPPTPPTPAPPTPPPPPPRPPLGYQPNFVLVLQDDMDLYMGAWTPMRQATELVSKHGATAKNWMIHTPVCCPSRGEILSGRYFHNLRTQGPNCMHIDTDPVNAASFATFLGRAGYRNAYFGKHLNNVGQHTAVPPGFDGPGDRWFAYGGDTVQPYGKAGGYFDSAFQDWADGAPVNNTAGNAVNGTLDHFHPVPGIYVADKSSQGEHAGYSASIIGNKSIAWVRERAAANVAAAAAGGAATPWMVTIGNRAPHAPFSPAPWYAEGSGPASAWIDNLTAPRTPDYNASCPDFHWGVAHQDIITEAQAAQTDGVFRNRWRALLSVDDGIAGMADALEELGLTNTTYLIVTSDHGWNLGQHRLPGGKHNVYDHAVRIPFVIRGPGIAAGSTFDFPASNVDVAPTLLGLAGADFLAAGMDGRSVAPLLVDAADPAVLPATQAHLARVRESKAGYRGGGGAGGLAVSSSSNSSRSKEAAPWRTFHPIEFFSLNNHTWFGHMIDDLVSNSYRALRFVADPEFGDLLYAEFTAVTDWHFDSPVAFELFNMTTDPHQLKNLYGSAPKELTDRLQARLVAQWACQNKTCP
jgi:arylsulfatase A-like enzyme